MTYQVLARKWRPRDFAQMVGQAHVVRALANALDGDRVHHAFLFTGTRGVGKTTLARIIAKCLNCEAGVSSTPCGECSSCNEIDEGRFVDLIEVDAASRSKVDETRELMDNVQYTPSRGRYKVYLIDEVHMFSEKSFNALLKTLEEPPPHVKFLLATTDPQKLPITVLSRCLQFNLKCLPRDEIAAHLEHILEAEGIDTDAASPAVISRAADGSMRDALSLLDQAIGYGGGRLDATEVRTMLGTLDQRHVHALLEALADDDAQQLMAAVELMSADAVDFSEALGEIVSALQRIATLQVVPESLDTDGEDTRDYVALAGRMSPEDVQLYYQIALLGRRDLPLAPDAKGGFQMAVLRMLAFRPEQPVQGEGVPPPPAPPRARAAAPPAASSPAPRASPQGGVPSEPVAGSIPLGRETWSGVVGELGLTGLARELALHCSVQDYTGGALNLQIAPEHEQLTTTRIKETLEIALARYCGAALRLHIDVCAPQQETPARQRERDAQTRVDAAVEAVKSDPGVQDICDMFGTQLDPSLVRPLDGQ